MECPQCQTENPEDNKFCRKCGTRLLQTCPECGAELFFSDQFCGKCGHNFKQAPKSPDYSEPHSYTPKFLVDKILTSRSSIEGERKLVTVLFADVANFTPMSEKLDPEEVHQIMDGCFKILMDEIHKFEGTINQFTGDGVMALFGAPIAHEDHAQRACYAALAIQKALESYHEKLKKENGVEFKMRIGLNSGPVIVGAIGDNLRMDYTAVGDTTNLAARMQSAAEAGTVLVSKNTFKIVSDFFQFDSPKRIEVKGKEFPQDVFKLIRKSDIDTRIAASALKGLTRFIGRENSMAVLLEAYEKVRSGSGQVVGVVGEAGVGKSRLILEMRSRIGQNDFTWLEGKCPHYGSSIAYLPIIEILKYYFSIKEEDREPAIRKKLESKILSIDERLKHTLTPFQELLAVKVDNEAYLQLDPGVKKIRKLEAIRDLLIRESQNRLLIVVVEDLHWMDKSSAECIQYLIDSLLGSCIMIILLHRPEYTNRWSGKSYYTQIGLDQLDKTSGAELVQAILEDGKASLEIKNLILDKAGGNPLFVEEITRNLIEKGFIARKGNAYILTAKASEIDVPDSIQGIISSRLDRLEENLKKILQVASVIGREFPFRILESIAGIKEDLKSCLLHLQSLEFIYEKKRFPEPEYIFKHALTREVAYSSLLQKRKKQIHEEIGHAIESLYSERVEEYYEVLAYHYERSSNKEKAIEYLNLANRKAVNTSALEDAKGYFDTAMQLLDTLPDTAKNRERRISLLINQAIVFEQLIQMTEYYNLLTRHESLLGDMKNSELASGFYCRLGHCELMFGSFNKAIDSATKAINFSKPDAYMDYTPAAYVILQWGYLYKGDLDRVIALKKEVIRMVAKQFNLYAYARSFVAASLAFTWNGNWEEAIKEGQHALTVSQQYSDNGHISFAAWCLSTALCLKGDIRRAIEYGELSLKSAPNPGYEAWAQCILAFAWCRAGEFDKGIAILEWYIRMFRTQRFLMGEVAYATFLAEGYLMAGKYDQAEQTANEELKIIEQSGVKLYIGRIYLMLGEVALHKDFFQAQSHFEKCIPIFKEIKAENMLAKAYAAFGRLRKNQGDFAQAREYFVKALEIFTRLGTLIDPDRVKQELAESPQESI